jgi:5-methylcytosine-specific restriction enzyme subunit McrC
VTFTVSEYGTIWLGHTSVQLEGQNLQLAPKPFEALKSLLSFEDDPNSVNEQFFKFSMRRGQECLRIQNYVGVLQCDGVQIEVLPKVSRMTDDIEDSRTLLIKMLATLADAPFKESQQADLAAYKMPLFEIVYRDFTEKAANTVRRGLARTYVREEGNLYFLRGKIKVPENIKHNVGLSNRVYCEFDEYDLDRPANRLLVAALEVVNRRSTNAENQQRARELLFHFEGVQASRDVLADFQAIVKDRNILHYEKALASARLILMRLNPLTQSGSNNATAMLFPMERVFEEYVAKKIKTQYRGWKVTTQTSQKYLVDDHAGKRMFALKPDIMLFRGKQKLVADTKWKLIDQTDLKNKFNISQADMYQLYAYGQKYLADQSARISILVYPKSDLFTSPLAPFWFAENESVLFVTPYDCQTDEWLLPYSLSQLLGSDESDFFSTASRLR